VTHGPRTSNTFQLYVHDTGGNLVGLCTELREVIEGSSADEIVFKARALIDSVTNRVKMRKPRIMVRMSPSLQKARS